MSDRRRVQMYTTGVGENEERVRERKRRLSEGWKDNVMKSKSCRARH